jgi:hypothetical protein
MEASGQLHAPAALSAVPTGLEDGCTQSRSGHGDEVKKSKSHIKLSVTLRVLYFHLFHTKCFSDVNFTIRINIGDKEISLGFVVSAFVEYTWKE